MNADDLERMKKDHWMHGIDDLLQIIYEKDEQIAALKAFLVQMQINELTRDGKACHDYTTEAMGQLARELPEIFGDDK